MKTNKTFSFLITEKHEGIRLDRFISEIDDIPSRSYAQDLIEKNQVSVNNKIERGSFKLKSGQHVEIIIPEIEQNQNLLPVKMDLDIYFEDEDLIVLNKPSGIVVHPSAGHQNDTIVNGLLYHTKELSLKNEQRPGIVHRIDKETSGLLVIAKNDFTHEDLSLQFKNKTTHRIYYALVVGTLNKKQGQIQSFLSRHIYDRKKYASVRINNKIVTEQEVEFIQGKWAVTHFTKLGLSSGLSYVKLKLETGRTHQIRVHMSELGFPLYGDIHYGFSKQKYINEKLERFYLHATELGFIHPRTKEKLLFKAKWPAIDEQKILDLGFNKNILYE